MNRSLEEAPLLAEALTLKAGRRVKLHRPLRGAKRKLLEDAERNAREALARRLGESTAQRRLLESLAQRFELEGAPDRVEVYDNSHISGTDAVGSMIVAGPEGYIKSAYRKFTIRSTAAYDPATPGDDYAMMREVLTRRFSPPYQGRPRAFRRVVAGPGADRWRRRSAWRGRAGCSPISASPISRLRRLPRGRNANAGRERVFLPDRPPVALGARDPLLYFLQRLRGRGASVCYRHPPGQARQGAGTFGARRDSGRRPPAQEGAAPPLSARRGG